MCNRQRCSTCARGSVQVAMQLEHGVLNQGMPQCRGKATGHDFVVEVGAVAGGDKDHKLAVGCARKAQPNSACMLPACTLLRALIAKELNADQYINAHCVHLGSIAMCTALSSMQQPPQGQPRSIHSALCMYTVCYAECCAPSKVGSRSLVGTSM